MKRILIPIDDSEYSKRAMAQGAELARTMGSTVVLVHVIPLMPQIRKGDPGALLGTNYTSAAEAMMKEAKASFGDIADRVETVILKGDPAGELLQYISSWRNIDVIIMGSHGIGSAARRFLIGSVTNKLLHHTNKPVLVIR